MNLAVLASPSSSLSHAHTSPAGVLTPPTGYQVNSAALSSNPSPVITNSQITRIMIDLYHSPAHASVGDSDSEAMDTLPASNGDREVLPEVMRRDSSATDLSVGQNSNFNPGGASSAGPAPPSVTSSAPTLLDLRREYKKCAREETKAQSHLDFIRTVPAPGSKSGFMVVSDSSSRPHFVEQKKGGRVLCDDNCPMWRGGRICSHTIVAERLNCLQGFLQALQKSKPECNLTSLT